METTATNETPDAPAPEPQAPTDDLGSVAKSWADKGWDFKATDPERAKEALEFHERYRGKKVYGEDEINGVVSQRFNEYLSRPDGRKQLADYLRQVGELREKAEEEGDPIQKRLGAMEHALTVALQNQQGFLQYQAQQKAEAELSKKNDKLESSFRSAIKAVPGADTLPRLWRDFWLEHGMGQLGEDPSETKVRNWVKTYVDEHNTAFASRKAAVRSPLSGSNGKGKKLEELSIDEAVAALGEGLPE